MIAQAARNHRTLAVGIFTMLSAFWLSSQPAAAQEFDCRDARKSAEHKICASDHLSALDETMSSLYARLWRVTDDDEAREGLRDYQRMFLAARDGCGRNAGCIKGAYLDQIEVLKSRLRMTSLRTSSD